MNNSSKTKTSLIRSLTFLFILSVALSSGLTSCKSKKKLAEQEAAAAQTRKLAKAKADLESILTDNTQTIEQKEAILSNIRSLNIEDAEIVALLAKAEKHVAQLKEEKLAKENAERLAKERQERMEKESGTKSLDEYFTAIANAPGTDQANVLISEALKQFASPESTVLIILVKYGANDVDYDRPTTISKYLNYIKDQKKSPNKVEKVILDTNGKIKELELIKK